jgi:hypothetical protein
MADQGKSFSLHVFAKGRIFHGIHSPLKKVTLLTLPPLINSLTAYSWYFGKKPSWSGSVS